MHFPHNIIIQYTVYRDSTKSSTVNYHILYDEQKEILEKLDIRNILKIEDSHSNLLLKLDVNIYDVSIETVVRGVLNNIFSKTSSIDNDSIMTNDTTIIDESYVIKGLPLKDLIFSFHQFVRNKGHFARDMKSITKNWDIALNKHYLAFKEDVIQDENITSLQENRIISNNSGVDSHKHFSIEQNIYNTLYSIQMENADKYYFIYYRIDNTNTFYRFIMNKGKDYKDFQEVQQKYDNIKINFDEAIDKCSLFYELENETLENFTKEQFESLISNFVLISGGQKKIKDYIKQELQIFKKYDWDMQLKIATLNANKMDSSSAVNCSKFCPFYENCNPINDSMIETMKNRRPIEAKENNINYESIENARKELKIMIRSVFWV